MTTNYCGSPSVRAVTVALAVVSAALGACSHGEQGRGNGRDDRAATAERRQAPPTDLNRERGAGLRVRIELPQGARLESSAGAQLAGAARQFATTLARWLYGDRREVDVEPIGAEARRDLANAPPYVPPDQIGSGDGQAIGVRVFVQTPRSGVLVVEIRDSRTSYSIPASFGLRGGHWRVVHLNTD